jgi:metallo-beta-lactamase class B
MKTSLRHAFRHFIAVAALCAGAAHAVDWNAPQEPFALFGSTYYVGTGGISSVLITSQAGHILVDGATPEAPAQIVRHVRQLGFRVEDIRYILTSHEHGDHAGGLAELQKLSGATVLASPAAATVLRSGQADKGDPQYTSLDPMAPVAKVRTVRDGEVVRLGPLAVTAHHTPGHTRGGTSWTWRSSEGGKTVDIVYADSLNAVAADGARFDGNPGYPAARADIERSMAMIAGLKCDVLVSAHPEFSGLWERKAKQPQLGKAAFIDENGCKDYVAKARERLKTRLELDAKTASIK